MRATQLERQAPPEVLDEAWKEYLREIRGLGPGRYDEVEAWAWARLQARLRMEKRSARRRAAA